MMDASHIKHEFRKLHGTLPELITQAPGRVNIIGEHTDYNGGLVMPAAINRYIWLAFGLSDNSKTSITALNADENIQIDSFSTSIDDANHWSAYLRAAALLLSEKGVNIPAFHCVFGGDIPIGSGLSSSAALSCGAITGLSSLSGVHFTKREVALMAQDLERRYIGLECGIMDQMACLFGKEGEAMLLDCLSLEMESVSLSSINGIWFLVDSGIKHSLAAESGYNERCRETAEGLEAIRKVFTNEIQFRDLNELHIQAIKKQLPTAAKRLRFFLKENARVRSMKRLVENGGSPEAIGAQLNDSHLGLQHDYDATCSETDYLAVLLRKSPGVYGARQVGGGFGGAVLVYAEKALNNTQKTQLSEDYQVKTGAKCTFLMFSFANGCQTQKIESS